MHLMCRRPPVSLTIRSERVWSMDSKSVVGKPRSFLFLMRRAFGAKGVLRDSDSFHACSESVPHAFVAFLLTFIVMVKTGSSTPGHDRTPIDHRLPSFVPLTYKRTHQFGRVRRKHWQPPRHEQDGRKFGRIKL